MFESYAIYKNFVRVKKPLVFTFVMRLYLAVQATEIGDWINEKLVKKEGQR